MTQPLGEEFINIRPLTAGFRAELQAQLAAALAAVAPQVAAAQSRLLRSASSTATLAGLPAAVNAAAVAQTRLGTTTRRTAEELADLADRNRAAGDAAKKLGRNIQGAETAAGRYTRGLFAATAASTGLFRAVSFASGAFLLGALAGGAAAAAVREFAQATQVTAQTAALLRATGDAANITAAGIDRLANAQLRLTGTDDELIKQAANVLLTFRNVRNETGRLNDIFSRAVKDVQDISSVFGTALTGSALQLGKALQDPIRGVTALRRSGITLSQGQRDLIKRFVETGRILSAQKLILGEVERQVGGTAAAIGRTLPGRLAILRESTKNTMGDFVKRISESERATKNFSETMKGLGDAFGNVFAVVKTFVGVSAGVAATIVQVTRLGDAFRALGGVRTLAQAVTIAAVAFGSLRLALGAATFAQGVYTRATTVAAAATAAEGVAAATAGTRIGLGAAALASLRGPLGISLGVTALTIGLLKLRDAGASAPGSLKATKEALDGLAGAIRRLDALRTGRAGAAENLAISRADRLAAQRGVTAAEAALARSRAQPGSIERRALEDDLRVARTKLVSATQKQTQAELDLASSQQDEADQQQTTTAETDKATAAIQKQIAALRDRAKAALGAPGIGKPALPGARRSLPEIDSALDPRAGARLDRAVSQAQRLFEGLAKDADKTKARIGQVGLAIVQTFGVLPTRRQMNVAIRLTAAGKSTQQILQALGLNVAGVPGAATGVVQTQAQVNARASAGLQEQARAARAALAAEQKRLRTLEDINQKHRDELRTQRLAVAAAKETLANARAARAAAIQGVADAQRSLGDARRQLLDTIRQGNETVAQAIRDSASAVNDAVRSAKQNLDSLGQSLADILSRFREQGGQQVAGNFGAAFQRLRAQILSGGGGPETQRAAQQFAFRAQQQPTAPSVDKIAQQIADLTDKLNRGQITGAQFNRRLDRIIGGITPAQIAKSLGTAVGNQFRDLVAAARAQARALTQGPRRAGGGSAPDVIRPLEAVAAGAKAIATARTQAAKDVAGAQRDMADATRGVTRAQRELQRADRQLATAQARLVREQAKETKFNTAATKANTAVLRQLVRVQAARNAKDKAKPRGHAAQQSGDLVNQGAVSP